jgi:hypothetical protein
LSQHLTPLLSDVMRSELAVLRETGPWFDLAERLRALANGEWSGEPLPRSHLAAASGLGSSVVARYISVYEKVVQIASARGHPPAALLSPSFNGVETACRLYQRSPDEGFKALVELKSGRTSLGTIRSTLASTPRGDADSESYERSLLLRRRGRMTEFVEEALQRSAENGLFGQGGVVRRRPGLRYFRRAGMEVVDRDGTAVAGIDVLTTHPGKQRDELDSAIGPSALLATYFPCFYLVCVPEAEEMAKAAVEALQWFRLGWIGVLYVDEYGAVDVIGKPQGRPMPDRTGHYEELKARWRVGRRADRADD